MFQSTAVLCCSKLFVGQYVGAFFQNKKEHSPINSTATNAVVAMTLKEENNDWHCCSNAKMLHQKRTLRIPPKSCKLNRHNLSVLSTTINQHKHDLNFLIFDRIFTVMNDISQITLPFEPIRGSQDCSRRGM